MRGAPTLYFIGSLRLDFSCISPLTLVKSRTMADQHQLFVLHRVFLHVPFTLAVHQLIGLPVFECCDAKEQIKIFIIVQYTISM